MYYNYSTLPQSYQSRTYLNVSIYVQYTHSFTHHYFLILYFILSRIVQLILNQKKCMYIVGYLSSDVFNLLFYFIALYNSNFLLFCSVTIFILADSIYRAPFLYVYDFSRLSKFEHFNTLYDSYNYYLLVLFILES